MSNMGLKPASVISPNSGPAARSSMVYSLQILRAIAAMLVVARHCAKGMTHSEAAFAIGQCGVDIFFVISGVVIYLTGRKLEWHVFLRRRIARIVPLYWLMTALVLLLDILRHQAGEANWLRSAISAFFFIPAHAPDGSLFPPLYVGWTLNFEMGFYLVCVLALLMGMRRRFLWGVSAMIAAVVLLGLPLLAAQGWKPTPATFLLMPISLEFVAGLWLAHAWCAGRRSSPRLCVALIAAALAWLALAPIATVTDAWRPFSWGIPALAISWAFLSLEEKLPFGRWRFGLALGDASYALYLIHPFAIGASLRLAAMLWPAIPMPLLFVLIFCGAVVTGLALHYLVELRLLVLAKRLLRLGSATKLIPRSPRLSPQPSHPHS